MLQGGSCPDWWKVYWKVSRIFFPFLSDIIITYLLTSAMVRSYFWEANWFATSQKIPRISRNRKAHDTCLLTYSMVQSPSWEANWFAACQEIPRISRNAKVHYRTHKRPPPVPILDQPNPVHIPTSHLLEIHHNIIHPSTRRSPQWSLSLRFPHQDPIHLPLLTHMRHMFSTLILLDFIIHTILGEEYKSFSSSLCSLLHSPVTSSLLCPNILLNTIFSNTLSFLSSLNVSDQVSHPYKTTGKKI